MSSSRTSSGGERASADERPQGAGAGRKHPDPRRPRTPRSVALETYENSTDFYAPDVCFDDAREYIPGVLSSRGEDPELGLAVLEQIRALVRPVDQTLYQDLEQLARQRVGTRDVEDWPVVAVAVLLNVPIWTEDRDFFGSGIAVWTTDRVELYLQGR